MDQQGDLGGNRAAKGGKKHHERGQNAKAKERCKQKVSRAEQVEVKRRCRRDKRVYVESEAEKAGEAGKRGDARTLRSPES